MNLMIVERNARILSEKAESLKLAQTRARATAATATEAAKDLAQAEKEFEQARLSLEASFQ